jgi:hypothetical protein
MDGSSRGLSELAHQVMANWYPSRPILGSPAWLWVVLAVPLFWLANLIPKGDFMDPDFRPSELVEPADRRAISKEQILVAREGDSFRFVPVAARDAARRAFREKKRIEPLWAVFIELSDHEESFGCGASDSLPGLIRREARWTYALKTVRVDYGFQGIDSEGDKKNPYELPPEQIRQLRPLLVTELNRRILRAKLGDRLEKMLDDGLEVSSTSFAPQNASIFLKWLASIIAFVGFSSMFVRPRALSIPRGALPMSQNEVLLIKIVTIRARLKKLYKDAC